MSVIKATDADFESALSSGHKTIVKFFFDWIRICKFELQKFKIISDAEGIEITPEAFGLISLSLHSQKKSGFLFLKSFI